MDVGKGKGASDGGAGPTVPLPVPLPYVVLPPHPPPGLGAARAGAPTVGQHPLLHSSAPMSTGTAQATRAATLTGLSLIAAVCAARPRSPRRLVGPAELPAPVGAERQRPVAVVAPHQHLGASAGQPRGDSVDRDHRGGAVCDLDAVADEGIGECERCCGRPLGSARDRRILPCARGCPGTSSNPRPGSLCSIRPWGSPVRLEGAILALFGLGAAGHVRAPQILAGDRIGVTDQEQRGLVPKRCDPRRGDEDLHQRQADPQPGVARSG
jgi:hypothetical protein